MPRTPRKKSSTGIYHVMLRGADRSARHGDGSFVLTEQIIDDMISTRKVITCLGRREKSRVREYTM